MTICMFSVRRVQERALLVAAGTSQVIAITIASIKITNSLHLGILLQEVFTAASGLCQWARWALIIKRGERVPSRNSHPQSEIADLRLICFRFEPLDLFSDQTLCQVRYYLPGNPLQYFPHGLLDRLLGDALEHLVGRFGDPRRNGGLRC
jgi:hypothetical protein